MNSVRVNDSLLDIIKITSDRIENNFIIGLPAKEVIFYENLQRIIKNNYQDPNYNVEQLASSLAMSSRTLYRKLEKNFCITPRELITSSRMERAYHLLYTGEKPSDIFYQVGFATHSAFTRCFKNYFGYPPNQVANI